MPTSGEEPPANASLPPLPGFLILYAMIPRSARNILVVRLSARGDVVLASPLAGAIKRAFPSARLTWIAEERTADMIRHNPHLDDVIVWRRASWKQMFRQGRWVALIHEALGFLDDLRRRRFDVALDAQGLLRSGAVAFVSGARIRIGLNSKEGSGLLMTRVVRAEDGRVVAAANARFAEALGLDASNFALEIPRGADERAAARRLMAEARLEDGFVAACPFTTRFYKHWLEDRWAALIARLPETTGLPVALLGGPADRPAADRIIEAVDGPVADFVGRTTLGEAAALVERCTALVGVDTGMTHMAHAFRRPAVALFGSNTPYLDPPGPQAVVLHSGRACAPCNGKLTCDGRVDCMRDLSVEQTLEAVAQRLCANGGVDGDREFVSGAPPVGARNAMGSSGDAGPGVA